MCITLDGLDSTIRSRTVALHACSFSRPKRVSIRPHKDSDAYAYHVRGGHGGVVCTQAGRNLFGHLGCGMMRALIDVCGPARMPSEPSEDSGNPCRRFFYNVETFSTQAGNRNNTGCIIFNIISIHVIHHTRSLFPARFPETGSKLDPRQPLFFHLFC